VGNATNGFTFKTVDVLAALQWPITIGAAPHRRGAGARPFQCVSSKINSFQTNLGQKWNMQVMMTCSAFHAHAARLH